MIIYNIHKVGDLEIKKPWGAIEHENALRIYQGNDKKLAEAGLKVLDLTGAVVAVKSESTDWKWVEPYTLWPIQYRTEYVKAA